jgi:hypothetical protein
MTTYMLGVQPQPHTAGAFESRRAIVGIQWTELRSLFTLSCYKHLSYSNKIIPH